MKTFKIIFLYLIFLSVFSLNALMPGQIAFFNAVISGDLNKVRECIEVNNASVNTYDASSRLKVALNIAAYNGKLDLVKYLLKNGAATNHKDDDDNTAIHIAAKMGYVDIVEALLAKEFEKIDKISISQPMAKLKRSDIINAKGNNGFTPLHFAVDNGRINDVRIFLLYSPSINVKAQDDSNNQPIHIAAKKGHKDIINLLLESGAEINCENGYDETPLHMAVEEGKQEIVQFLLNKGADINAKNQYGSTPLHRAINRRHSNIVKFLLDNGANINSKDKDGEQPLHLAAFMGNMIILQLLLDKGAPVDSLNNDKKSPLDIATEEGLTDVVNLLNNVGGGLPKTLEKLRTSLTNLKNKLSKLSEKLSDLKNNLTKK